jgi:hypothetical protein
VYYEIILYGSLAAQSYEAIAKATGNPAYSKLSVDTMRVDWNGEQVSIMRMGSPPIGYDEGNILVLCPKDKKELEALFTKLKSRDEIYGGDPSKAFGQFKEKHDVVVVQHSGVGAGDITAGYVKANGGEFKTSYLFNAKNNSTITDDPLTYFMENLGFKAQPKLEVSPRNTYDNTSDDYSRPSSTTNSRPVSPDSRAEGYSSRSSSPSPSPKHYSSQPGSPSFWSKSPSNSPGRDTPDPHSPYRAEGVKKRHG